MSPIELSWTAKKKKLKGEGVAQLGGTLKKEEIEKEKAQRNS